MWKRGEMKMRIKVCQGVGGIIIVTMVTGFMLAYNSSSGGRSHSSSSHLVDFPVPATKKPDKLRASTLEGYTGVMDFKRYGNSQNPLKSFNCEVVQFMGGSPDQHVQPLFECFKLRRQPLKMHCRTCALVTSSGQLTRSKRGEEIDRSECVIRMNDAPCTGYQQDVGRRTSLRVVAHSSLQRVLRSRQELLNGSQDSVFIFWGPSSSMRRDGRGHVYNNLRLLKQLQPKLKVYIISRIKMLKFDELFKKETGIDRKRSNSWLSTGWFTMATALELCDRINVYGMVPPNFCRASSHPTVPYHYYEPSGSDECSMYLLHERSRRGSHHRFITEKMVFSNWARSLNIHFFQPDWKPAAAIISSMNRSYTSAPV